MGSLFLLLILIFVVWPLTKFAWRVYRFRKNFRSAFTAQGGDEPEPRRESRKGGWSMPRQQKKKVYARDEGEYVKWEEVTVESSQTVHEPNGDRYTETRSYTSERVTDVEWEEIDPED